MADDADDLQTVLKSLFTKFDVNETGSLCQDELEKLLSEDFGMDEEQVYSFSLLLDKDGSGTLTFDEFSRVLNESDFVNRANKGRAGVIERAVALFKKYDVDESHALGKPEFHEIYTDMGGQDSLCDREMNKIDFDDNARISFNEFLRWLNWVQMDVFEK